MREYLAAGQGPDLNALACELTAPARGASGMREDAPPAFKPEVCLTLR